jgi:sortase A
VPPPRPRPVYSTALCILAAVLLGFVAQVTLVGALQHSSDQRRAYDHFRSDLALATAPVGQTGLDGKVLPLGTLVAILEIPRLGVSEVVGEGTTSTVLRSGPGHRRDTVLPGQAGASVILGRQATYGGPFGHLKDLVIGDKIVVTTGQGRHVYTVRGLRRAGDPLPPPLAEGKGSLVLVTGDGPRFMPSGVLRVDADLRTPAMASPARPIALGSLPTAEQVMAGDPSAWVLVVLWGQALLIAALLTVWLATRWGRWQTWLVAVPVLTALGLTVSDHVSRLLPNLL